MRALCYREYGGPEVHLDLDLPEPVPGSGQVLIELAASGINPGDIKVRNGENPAFEVTFPMAVGREASGTVIDVGPEVTAVSPGDRVFGAAAAGTGTVAERVLLNASATARIPDGLGWSEAASIPVSVGTAYDALDELGLQPGQTLLVVGAGGGVGSAAVQLAAARGITVIGAASAAKRADVTRYGAIHVASGAGWLERVRAAAGGPVDGVFDLVGYDVLRDAATTRRDADAPLISVASSPIASELGGSGVTRRRTTEVFARCAALAAGPDLRIQIGASYPFERAAQAVADVESGHARGNVVVVRASCPPYPD